MTKRGVALTVILNKPYRDDDAEYIMNAIRMIKGVHDVKLEIMDAGTYWAKDTARRELLDEILNLPQRKDG